MRAAGIPGLLRALVDADSAVARLQFVPDAATPLMREEGRRITATWNRVVAGTPDEPNESKETTTRWTSDDKHSSALIRYRRHASTPSLVQVTDRHSFGSIARSSTLAPMILALNELADVGDIGPQADYFEALRLLRLGKAIDAGVSTAIPAAATAATCTADPGIPIPKTPIDAEAPNPRLSIILQSVFAKAFDGAKLILSDSGAKIVDVSGRSERIRLGPLAISDADVLTLGVHFPERATQAIERLIGKDTDNLCRTSADVLFAKLEPNGSVKSVRRVPVGDDGYASNIELLELVPHDLAGDTAYIRVRYTTAYGTDDWVGAVEWEGRISIEPARLVVRAPLAYGGLTSKGRADDPVGILITGRMTDSVELSTVDTRNGVHGTRSVVVPMSASAVLEGNSILDALLERVKPTSN
jgi:hypothetical protein